MNVTRIPFMSSQNLGSLERSRSPGTRRRQRFLVRFYCPLKKPPPIRHLNRNLARGWPGKIMSKSAHTIYDYHTPGLCRA